MQPGKRIKEFRLEKGLTQKELADAIKYSDAYLSEIERGVSKPSRDFLIKLTEVYGISTDYVLHGSEDEQKKYLLVKEPEFPYQIVPTATKKLLDSVKEILESGNEIMIDALKANIKAFLEAVRVQKKTDEDKGGF